MPLAPQVANPGSRGQDSRYKFDPTFMVDLGGGLVTDGQYTYRMDDADSMLSLDRPSVALGGLPPADDSDSVRRYSQSLRPGQGATPGGGPAAPPPPPTREFVPLPKLKMGEQNPNMRFYDVGDWSDPTYGAQNKDQYRTMLNALLPVIQKANPGLYKNQAAFDVDVNAIMAGKPNLSQPYKPPQVAPPTNPARPIQPQTKQPAVLKPAIPVKAPAPQPKPIVRIQPQTKKPAVILPPKKAGKR